jgi:D-glycero-D-manno-heptose 1,7-bisphosphate phosphatase
MNKAFFFDRDGIVNKRIIGDYVKNIEEFDFIPEFFKIFQIIDNNNFLKVLVTNQQGIGKGLMTDNDLSIVHQFMQKELIGKIKTKFDAIYYCPSLVDSNSKFRKPEPGMLLRAAKEQDIDLSSSFMIGDSKSDIVAGKRAGCKTIFINENPFDESDFWFKDHKKLLSSINKII